MSWQSAVVVQVRNNRVLEEVLHKPLWEFIDHKWVHIPSGIYTAASAMLPSGEPIKNTKYDGYAYSVSEYDFYHFVFMNEFNFKGLSASIEDSKRILNSIATSDQQLFFDTLYYEQLLIGTKMQNTVRVLAKNIDGESYCNIIDGDECYTVEKKYIESVLGKMSAHLHSKLV